MIRENSNKFSFPPTQNRHLARKEKQTFHHFLFIYVFNFIVCLHKEEMIEGEMREFKGLTVTWLCREIHIK